MPETCREQHHTSGNRLRLAAVCQASAKLQVRPKDGGRTLGLPPDVFGKHWKPTLPSPPAQKRSCPVFLSRYSSKAPSFLCSPRHSEQLQGEKSWRGLRCAAFSCRRIDVLPRLRSLPQLGPRSSLKRFYSDISDTHGEPPRQDPCKNSAQDWHLICQRMTRWIE